MCARPQRRTDGKLPDTENVEPVVLEHEPVDHDDAEATAEYDRETPPRMTPNAVRLHGGLSDPTCAPAGRIAAGRIGLVEASHGF